MLWMMACRGTQTDWVPATRSDGGGCELSAIDVPLAPITTANAERLELVGTLCVPGESGAIHEVFDAAGSLYAVGEINQIQRWDVSKGTTRSIPTTEPVRSAAWSSRATQMVLGFESGALRAYDLNGQLRWTTKADQHHTGGASALTVRDEHDDVFSGGADGWVRRWHVADGALLARRNTGGSILDVTVREDDIVVCGDGLGTHALHGDTLTPGESWSKREEKTFALAVRPHANHLAVATTRVTVWEGLLETRLQTPIQGAASTLAYHPTGDLLAVGTWTGQVLIYDSAGRALLKEQKADMGRVLAATFSQDGTYLATAGDGGRIRIWGVVGVR